MTTLEISTTLSLFIIALAIAIALHRLYRGPGFADRVIVFDLISAASIGLMAVLSHRLEKSYLLDAALMVSLLSFLGTVGFASFLERSTTIQEEEEWK